MVSVVIVVAIGESNAWLSTWLATIAGMGGTAAAAVPFLREDGLKAMREVLRSGSGGNRGAERVLKRSLSHLERRMDRRDPAARSWILRGLALLAASYLFNLIAFVQAR